MSVFCDSILRVKDHINLRRKHWKCGLSTLVAGLFLAAQAQAITPVQTYYVPLEESDIQPTLHILSATGAGTTLETVVSIAVGFNETVIHYDHAEDGYEADLDTAPSQGSTLIWGDGDLTNGIAPGFPGDLLNAGDVVVLQNAVPLPRIETDILFDAADKFITSSPVAVTRAAWALDPGTVLAGAVEVYPTSQWGTQFESPIGEDIAIEDHDIFELVTASYMAAEDGTLLDFDFDGDGTIDATVPLDEGESVYTPPGDLVSVGATGTSNKPVQVHAITGDIGAQWESRWAIVFPSNLWSNEYFVPVSTRAVSTDDRTDVFLYNPNDSVIDVTMQTFGPATTVIMVPARGNARVTVPDEDSSAARFFTAAGETFYAIAAIDANAEVDSGGSGTDSDSNNRDYDWGFTSVPPDLLSSQALVGFAPSIDPNACVAGSPFNCSPPNGPGSPVWVMSVEAGGTTVLVDFDADPSTGPLTDSNNNKYDMAVVLAGLTRAKIFDDDLITGDNDMTGALLYTEDGSFIAVAWGQDPASSVRTNPYFDAGTVIPPLPSFTIVKEVNEELVEPGAELTYTITVTNTSRAPLPSVLLSDELPPYTTYVAGTSELDGNAFSDAGVTPFPLDEDGATLTGPLQPGTSFVFTFDVLVDEDVPINEDEVGDCEDPQTRLLNLATATAVNFTASDDALTCVVFTPNIEIEKATNGFDADDPNAGDAPQIGVGDPVTWTYKVTNTGQLPLSNVNVSDDIIGAINCPQNTLDVGEMMTCTAMGVAADLFAPGATTVPGLCGDFPQTPLYENMGTASGETVTGEVVQDVDPSHYCNPPMPSIDIEKATNGVDADNAGAGDAPVIVPGGAVNWTYVVTNTGDVTLTNVAVLDDQGVGVSCPQNTLTAGEAMICTASGFADDLNNTGFTTVPGLCGGYPGIPLYENKGAATGETTAGGFVEDVDPSHYCNPQIPSIDIEKATNGVDADDPNAGDAPVIAIGGLVSWSYVVTNTGDVPLMNIAVTDDQGVAVSCPQDVLAAGAMMTCTASGLAENLLSTGFTTVPGLCGSFPNTPLYENKGTARGEPIVGGFVQDVDPSHYCNPQNPDIDIEKATNGVDADDPNAGDAPQLMPGDAVTWTYVVTNTGNVPLTDVEVVDDQGVVVSCPQVALAVGAMMTCTANGVAEDLPTTGFTTVPGLCGELPDTPLYENKGVATGMVASGDFVEDVDPSHYCNPPEEEIACRVTGGLNDTFATLNGVNRYQAGGQAGANTGAQPQPKGEWTHHQQSGPAGDFTFHGGTSSAPEGSEIHEIRCSDPGGCGPSGNPPSPAKQLDFDGIGTFKNIGKSKNKVPDFVTDGATVTAMGNGNKDFDGTLHWFEVNIDDLGEPGNSNPNKNPDDPNPELCPVIGFGEKGADPLAHCGCSDFYRITIYDGVNAADVIKNPDGSIDPGQMNRTDVIYEVWGYIDGGNLQLHQPTGFDRK